MPEKRTVPSGTPSHQMVVKVTKRPLIGPAGSYHVVDEPGDLDYWIAFGQLPPLDAAMREHDTQHFGASVVEPIEGRTFLAINPSWPVDDAAW